MQMGDSLLLEVVSPGGVLGSFGVKASDGSDLQEAGWLVEPCQKSPGLWIEVTPLKVGKLVLPELLLEWEGKAQAKTKAYPIEVLSSIQKEDPTPEKSEDFAPPVALPFPRSMLVVSLGVVLLLLLVGFLLYRRRSRVLQVEKKLPADEEAWNAIFLLEKKDWIEKKQFKLFYFRLSEILKKYVGDRFAFDALESTTREILLVLEKEEVLSEDWKVRFISIFEQLDRVKFTDHLPVSQEPVALLQEARAFVVATRKPPLVGTSA